MIKNYDIQDFIEGCNKQEFCGLTVYEKDGIRYVNLPNILISTVEEDIDYNEINTFNMDKVEIILEHLGLNQVDLANELGLTRKAITKYKIQTSDPRLSTVLALRKALYKLSEKRSGGNLFLSMSIEELFL